MLKPQSRFLSLNPSYYVLYWKEFAHRRCVAYRRRGFLVPNIPSVPQEPVFCTECLWKRVAYRRRPVLTPHVHSVHQKAFFSTEYNKRQKKESLHLLPVMGAFRRIPNTRSWRYNTTKERLSVHWLFGHSLVAYSTVFRLKIVELLWEIVLAFDNDILVCLQTGTGRNKVSADNVFLKSFKMIDSSPYGCLAENLGVLLEAGPCLLLLMNSARPQRTYLDSIPKIWIIH